MRAMTLPLLVGAALLALTVWAWLTIAGREPAAVFVAATAAAPTIAATPTAAAIVTATAPPAPTLAPTAPPDPSAAILGRLCAEEPVRTAQDAVAISREGQDIHRDWIAYLESGGTTTDAGDEAWHRRWVDNYEVVLEALAAYLDACAQGGLTQ